MIRRSGHLERNGNTGVPFLGADALELFNFFCTDQASHRGAADGQQHPWARYDVLTTIGELSSLRGKTKQYGHWLYPEFEYAEQVPFVLESGHKRSLTVAMCHEPSDAGLELIVQLVVEEDSRDARLGVSVNGSWPCFEATPAEALLPACPPLTQHVEAHRAWNIPVPIDAVRDGRNEVLVFNAGSTGPVRIESLELAVRRRGG